MNDHLVFETKRLFVRTATPDDADLFYKLWTNPSVMAMVGYPRGMDISKTDVLERLSEQDGTEFGQLLIVVMKDSSYPSASVGLETRKMTGSLNPTSTYFLSLGGTSTAWKSCKVSCAMCSLTRIAKLSKGRPMSRIHLR